VTGTHSVRDIEEMKAHDLAINQLRTLASDTQPITESEIRSLNATLLKEPFFKEARTEDGQATRKQITPGEYKTTPNNVIQKDGSLFEFTPPDEVPEKMHELVKWIRKELESPTVHPIEFATILHLSFVLIHPFDDGNGRTARLLVNYILLKNNYPPLIVRTETKADYLAALQLADSGELSRLTEFLAKELEWSLDLSIKAAAGESIEEVDDLDKEIAIFTKNQQDQQHSEVVRRNAKVLKELYDISFKKLLDTIQSKVSSFDGLFETTEIQCNSKPSNWKYASGHLSEMLNSPNVNWGNDNSQKFQTSFHFKGYKGDAASPFNLSITFDIDFTPYEYHISAQNTKGLGLLGKYRYSEIIDGEKISEITSSIQRAIFNQIKNTSK